MNCHLDVFRNENLVMSFGLEVLYSSETELVSFVRFLV